MSCINNIIYGEKDLNSKFNQQSKWRRRVSVKIKTKLRNFGILLLSQTWGLLRVSYYSRHWGKLSKFTKTGQQILWRQHKFWYRNTEYLKSKVPRVKTWNLRLSLFLARFCEFWKNVLTEKSARGRQLPILLIYTQYRVLSWGVSIG